jgi:hypothetical protein
MDNYRKDNTDYFRDSSRQRGPGKNVNAAPSYSQDRYMRNREPKDDHSQWGSTFRSRESREPDDRNIRVGEKLHDSYNRNDYDRYGHRREDREDRSESRHDRNQRKWDEGNFFHTGPNPSGSRQYQEERDSHHTTSRHEDYFSNHYRNQDRQLKGMHDQHGHYGARPDSVYRRPDNLNYGDQRQNQGSQKDYVPFGSGYEPQRRPMGLDHSPHTEGPGTGSRYKEDDYRYGSGNHNFYKEGRYQRGGGIGQGFDDNKGFFERVGDGIRDAWTSVTNRDEDNVPESDNRYYRKDKDARGRNFDRGYESGPRWADESETHRNRSSSSPQGYRRSTDPERRSWTDFDQQREKRW